MKKTILAGFAALGLLFAAPSVAQNVAPNSNIAVLPLPGMLAACMPIKAANELMEASDFSPLFRGEVGFVHSDGKIRISNDASSRMTIYYSAKQKQMVNFLWSEKRGIACLTHTMMNVTLDESAWREVGRLAKANDDE